jgi:hypothetical protein
MIISESEGIVTVGDIVDPMNAKKWPGRTSGTVTISLEDEDVATLKKMEAAWSENRNFWSDVKAMRTLIRFGLAYRWTASGGVFYTISDHGLEWLKTAVVGEDAKPKITLVSESGG